MIEVEHCLPDARLMPYIKMYFWGRDMNPPLSQRVVPNGEMGLMFYRDCNASLDGVKQMHACVKGQSVRYHDIVSHGGIEIVCVHFTVLGARLILGTPLYEFYEDIVELSDMDDVDLKMLGERVLQTENHRECWSMFDSFFLHRLMTSKVNELNIRRLHRAISYSRRQVNEASVDRLAEKTCLCTRQFRRLFSDMVGLSPKDYLRVQRYHTALQDLKCNRGNAALSEIAWRNGYYDLSHLYADFLRISGYAPKSLLEISQNDCDPVGWRI